MRKMTDEKLYDATERELSVPPAPVIGFITRVAGESKSILAGLAIYLRGRACGAKRPGLG
jgi:hypothetical protein